MKAPFFLVIVAVSCAASLCGCSRRPSNPRASLVGQYRLRWGTGSHCSGRGIENSILELRDDSTSEQHDRFKDGSEYVTAGKWQYEGGDNIGIHNLRATTTLEIDKNAGSIRAGLIVQWSKPPSILLDPDDDCLFAKVQ